MVFYAYHGVAEAEQVTGRRVEVDVDLYTDLRRAGGTDDLNATINYATVYDIVKDVVRAGPYNLLETVAETIAARLSQAFSVQRVTVRVRKVHPPVDGHIDYAEVEITRTP